MNKRKEQILNDLREDKNFIEGLIKHDIVKIEQYQRSLSSRRNELTEINDLIRKLDVQ